MLRGTLMTSVCRQYSRIVEGVCLHKEVKVSYRHDKAEPSRWQSYVDRVGLERLVPADHSQVHTAARLHRGRDCTKAQVTPHLIRREGTAERRQSPALWDILNICMNEIGHRNHTSNPAPPLSVNCAAGVILHCSPSATSPWCDPFWTRHCRCMNLHLCLTPTQLILHSC
jgi:hypothetical protein